MKERKKVNYPDYEGKFNEEALAAELHSTPEKVDMEKMREQMYGYTFTEEYSRGAVADALSMDYWRKHKDWIWPEHDLLSRVVPNPLTFTEDEDEDLFRYYVKSTEEKILLDTLISTGDGKSPETAIFVIDTGQEYEFMGRVYPYRILVQKGQALIENKYDRIDFEPNRYGIESLYFDVSACLERHYNIGNW